MSTFLENLRARRHSKAAIEHDFRTSRGTGKYDIFLVFEGEEDELVYCQFIDEKLAGTVYKPIIGDGKGTVLAFRDYVHRKYPNDNNIFYFIDSDHDKYVNIDHSDASTFLTDGYSIESYFLSKKIFQIVARKAWSIRIRDGLCEDIDRIYDESLCKFTIRAKTIMSFAVLLRRKNHDLDLEKLPLSSLFEIQNGKFLKKTVSCSELKRKVDCGLSNNYKEVRNILRELKGEPVESLVRGKLVIQFLAFLVENLDSLVSNSTKMNGKALKKWLNIGKRNYIKFAQEYLDCPDSLSNFISTRLTDFSHTR